MEDLKKQINRISIIIWTTGYMFTLGFGDTSGLVDASFTEIILFKIFGFFFWPLIEIRGLL